MKKDAFIRMIVLIIIFLPILFFTRDQVSQKGDIKNESSDRLQVDQSVITINNSNSIPISELTRKSENGWRLVWNDEFNRELINNRFWTLQNGGGIWGNNELQCYTDRSDNCYIENGKLMIRAIKESYKDHQYTSARIITRDKVDFLYGKIEIKAKLPSGKGLFPAFWLLPSNDNYGSRNKNGEIDIVELLGNDTRFIYGVAHYSLNDEFRSYKKYNDNNKDFSKDFHVYSIEWSQDRIIWLIDDREYFTFDLEKKFNDEYNPFNKKFYLIMNLAVGGNWPGFDFTNTTFPAHVEIDYVRYYKR